MYEEPPFRTSVMLWTLGIDEPFDHRLETVAAAGYRAVELAGEYHAWSQEDFRRNDRKRRELGITFDATAGAVVAPGRWRHNASDPGQREAFLDDIRAELTMMERLECPELIVLGGDLVPGLTAETQHASCVEALKRAAELAEGHSVTILLENVDREENPDYIARSVEETVQVISEVDHPGVKLCYDLFHAQISGGNLIANLERHIDRVGKVHIGDVPGHHEPGTGEINFTNIYRKLAELDYDGYVAMEFISGGDPATTLAEARRGALLAANAPSVGATQD